MLFEVPVDHFPVQRVAPERPQRPSLLRIPQITIIQRQEVTAAVEPLSPSGWWYSSFPFFFFSSSSFYTFPPHVCVTLDWFSPFQFAVHSSRSPRRPQLPPARRHPVEQPSLIHPSRGDSQLHRRFDRRSASAPCRCPAEHSKRLNCCNYHSGFYLWPFRCRISLNYTSTLVQ